MKPKYQIGMLVQTTEANNHVFGTVEATVNRPGQTSYLVNGKEVMQEDILGGFWPVTKNFKIVETKRAKTSRAKTR